MDDIVSIEHRHILSRYILDLQQEKAVSYLSKLSKDYSYSDTIDSCLVPLLAEVGELWARQKISLAQGYIAGKVAEEIYEEAVANRELGSTEAPIKPHVVVGNIEDDFHSFGRKLVATFLRLDGWQVHDLGNDVTPVEFMDKAEETGSVIVAASAMMYITAENILHLREEIDKRGAADRIKLAVGGAVFNLSPELVKEVGGDGTANSAMQASALFDSLLRELKGEPVK